MSTVSCERAFLVQNAVKTKFCNTLKTKDLESVLCVVLEEPYDNVEAILIEAIFLWKMKGNIDICMQDHKYI